MNLAEYPMEHSSLMDRMDGLLKRRPDRQQLVRTNILKSEGVLSSQRTTLEKQMKMDTLHAKIRSRPVKASVIEAGILEGEESF